MRPLQRLGLLGDIHAEDVALSAALRALADAGAERIVSVGDLVDGPGSVERCCELLAEAGAISVRGNHERWFLAGTMRELPEATRTVGAEARRFLAALPATVTLPTARGDILVCHGLGDDDMASIDTHAHPRSPLQRDALGPLLDWDRPLWVLHGHSHRRGVYAHDRTVLVNGGTLYGKHEPCFALVDLDRDEVTFRQVWPDGRLGAAEVVPLPPPRGGRG